MVRHSQDSVERLRGIPLAEVIPAIWPGAYRSRERQGPGRVRWVLPDGTKVNVLPLADGDLFRFMNRSNDVPASASHKGAINFVMAVRRMSAPPFCDIRNDVMIPRERGHQSATIWWVSDVCPTSSSRICIGAATSTSSPAFIKAISSFPMGQVTHSRM